MSAADDLAQVRQRFKNAWNELEEARGVLVNLDQRLDHVEDDIDAAQSKIRKALEWL